MFLKQIETLRRSKAKELTNRYLGKLIRETAIEQPEEIGDYGLEPPRKIEAEYL